MPSGDLEVRANRNTAHVSDLVKPNIAHCEEQTRFLTSANGTLLFYPTMLVHVPIFLWVLGVCMVSNWSNGVLTWCMIHDKSQVLTRHCAEGKASRVRYAQPHWPREDHSDYPLVSGQLT